MHWKSFPQSLKFEVNLLDLLIQLNLLDFSVEFVTHHCDLTTYTLFSSNKVNIKSDQFTVFFFLFNNFLHYHAPFINPTREKSPTNYNYNALYLPPSIIKLELKRASKRSFFLLKAAVINARRHIQPKVVET